MRVNRLGLCLLLARGLVLAPALCPVSVNVQLFGSFKRCTSVMRGYGLWGCGGYTLPFPVLFARIVCVLVPKQAPPVSLSLSQPLTLPLFIPAQSLTSAPRSCSRPLTKTRCENEEWVVPVFYRQVWGLAGTPPPNLPHQHQDLSHFLT